MFNHIYQLIQPKTIAVKYADVDIGDKVIVRPEYMSICQADQRYYQGLRDAASLRKKLPMALIHECCGRVLYDPEGKLEKGSRVVLVPNIPGEGEEEIGENYRYTSHFMSSGYDGFMQELVPMDRDRLVLYTDTDPVTAAVTEYVSVGVQTAGRFGRFAHSIRRRIGIWGDGSLAYVVANVIHEMYPDTAISVIGLDRYKMSMFSFVDEVIKADEIPEGFAVDHAFECCGGTGSAAAIRDIIDHINPEGALMLMGVSEEPVAVNTRMVLEKGLRVIGSSRSGAEDFRIAVELLSHGKMASRIRRIITEEGPVRSIADIHRAFSDDMNNPFKTVLKWEL